MNYYLVKVTAKLQASPDFQDDYKNQVVLETDDLAAGMEAIRSARYNEIVDDPKVLLTVGDSKYFLEGSGW